MTESIMPGKAKVLSAVSCAVILSLIMSVQTARGAMPEAVEVTVQGQVLMQGQGAPAAEKAALKEAYREAVVQGLGVYVRSDTEVKDSVAVRDQIVSKAEGYILNYTILRSWEEGGVYYVSMRANVALKRIGADFKTLVGNVLAASGRPSVAFLLTAWETSPSDPNMKTPSENTAITDGFDAEFRKLGFRNLKYLELTRDLATQTVTAGRATVVAADQRTEYIRKSAEEGAKYLVLGEVILTSDDFDNYMGVYKAKGRISCIVLDVDTKESVASYSESFIATDDKAHEAFESLKRKAAIVSSRSLAENIIEQFQDQINDGEVFKIYVENISNYDQESFLSDTLESLCEIRSSSESGAKTIYEVYFKGNSIALKKAIMEKMRSTFPSFNPVRGQSSRNLLTFTF